MLDEAALGAAMLQSARLWVKGHSSEALNILDEWIAKAEQENQIDWVDTLCGQASMIAGEAGDLRLVKQYCEKVLSQKGETTFDWAMAHYRLADAMFRHGEIDTARQHAAKSYALVAHSTRDEDRGLLELLVKNWPEISNWKAYFYEIRSTDNAVLKRKKALVPVRATTQIKTQEILHCVARVPRSGTQEKVGRHFVE